MGIQVFMSVADPTLADRVNQAEDERVLVKFLEGTDTVALEWEWELVVRMLRLRDDRNLVTLSNPVDDVVLGEALYLTPSEVASVTTEAVTFDEERLRQRLHEAQADDRDAETTEPEIESDPTETQIINTAAKIVDLYRVATEQGLGIITLIT